MVTDNDPGVTVPEDVDTPDTAAGWLESPRRFLRLINACVLSTVPAWLFWLLVLTPSFSETSVRVFALVAVLLSTALGLLPTVQSISSRLGRSSPEWPAMDAAVVAVFGGGAVISVLLNGSRSIFGLETIVAAAVAANGIAAIYQFSRVASKPSPAGAKLRESAQGVLDEEKERSAESNPIDLSGTTIVASGDVSIYAQAEVGRQDIAEGFRRYGDSNESSARLFLVTGVLTFAASVVAALWLVSNLGESAGVATILSRAVITIPGAAVFGVFVRESAARRRYAAWGGLIAIQAEHIGAFVSDMPVSSREELELSFAKAIFRGGDVALDNVDGRSAVGRFKKNSGPSETMASDSLNEQAKVTIDVAKETLGLVKSYDELLRQVTASSKTAGQN